MDDLARPYTQAGALALGLLLTMMLGCAADDGGSGGGSQGTSSSAGSGPGTSGGPGGTSSSGGSGTSSGTGSSSTSGTAGTAGSSGGSTGGGGGGLDVPQTVEMMAGVGGSVLWADVCQYLAIGGGLNYTLEPGGGISSCQGGEILVEFTFAGANMEYALWAGTVLTETFDGPAVTFATTTHGMIEFDDIAMQDVVRPLPEATSITVTTDQGASLSFEFAGAEITLTEFSAP